MADVIQSEVVFEKSALAVEQKFATGVAIQGDAPELATNPFAPYAGEDGILRYKQADDVSKDEADKGGLFVLNHQQPGVLEWVLMDLSSIEDWTVSIVTSAGQWQVDAGNGRYVIINPKAPLMPGENVKITATTTTGKAWIRIYIKADHKYP